MKTKFTAICMCACLANGANAEPMYDCWIGNADESKATTHFIRCITDRLPLEEGLQLVENSQEAILEEIHSYLHDGHIDAADSLLRMKTPYLGTGDYANILLYSYPAEWSWQDFLPHKLVQSALCYDTGGCKARFFSR